MNLGHRAQARPRLRLGHLLACRIMDDATASIRGITLVDRVIHHAQVNHIEGESYRRNESNERAKAKLRATTETTKPASPRR